jgi:tetratricopeptide (TPR) repeat protein
VVFDSDPSFPRYRLLETIRQFAVGKSRTEDGEKTQAALSDRHADVYLDLVERAKPHLRAADQVQWFDRLEIEHDNIRAALHHLLAEPSGPLGPSAAEKAMRMATALKWFWQIRSYRVDALDIFTKLSSLIGPDDASLLHATVLADTGEFLLAVSSAQSGGCYERALQIARELGEDSVAALALSGLASLSGQQGETESENDLRRQAVDLARASNDKLVLADVLCGPTQDGQHGPRLEEAIDYYDAAGDRSGRYIALLDLGAVSLSLAEPKTARNRLEAAVELGRALGVGQDQTLLVNLAETYLLEGDYPRAKDLYKEAVRVARRHADGRAAQYASLGLALCATADGDSEMAAKLHGFADHQLKALGYVWAPENLALAEADRSRLKSILGPDGFEEAFAAGESWDIDEAMRLINATS